MRQVKILRYKIGSRIKKYRQKKGLSQVELAEKLGVSNSCVSNWEQGINRPDADMISVICDHLDISPSELFGVAVKACNPADITEHESNLLEAYRKASSEIQKVIDRILGI